VVQLPGRPGRAPPAAPAGTGKGGMYPRARRMGGPGVDHGRGKGHKVKVSRAAAPCLTARSTADITMYTK